MVSEGRARLVDGWMTGLAAVGVAVLVLAACAEGIGRVVFGVYYGGLPTATGAGITAYAFLLLADGLAHGRLAHATLFERWLTRRSPVAAGLLAAVVETISAILFAYVSYVCAMGSLEVWSQPDRLADPAEFSGVIMSAFVVVAVGAAMAAGRHGFRLIGAVRSFNAVATGAGRSTRDVVHVMLWVPALAVVIWVGYRLLLGDVAWSGATALLLALAYFGVLASGMHVVAALMLFFPFVAGLHPDPNTIRIFLVGSEAAIVPVLILVALLFHACGMARDLEDAARALVGRARTGAGLASLWTGALAGTMTASVGDSGGDSGTDAVGRNISAMVRAGFWPRTAVGIVAAGTSLGAVLPPGLVLALYAMDSHAGAFAFAALAGVIVLVAMTALVVLPGSLRDGAAPQDRPPADPAPPTPQVACARLIRALAVPAVILIAVFSERFTLAEAGGLAALAILLIGFWAGRLRIAMLWPLLAETGRLSVPVLLLLVASGVYAWVLTATGLVQAATILIDVPGYLGIAAVLLVAVIALLRWLGLDALSTLMVLFAMWLPMMKVLSGSIDPDLFGVALLLMVQVAVALVPSDAFVAAVRGSVGDGALPRYRITAAAAPFAVVMTAVGVFLLAVSSLGWWGM